jgi:LuxR family maltose regulon positive regulatory protein
MTTTDAVPVTRAGETATSVPSAPSHAVDRPELRRRLDEALGSPLTLVVAPAGSGKTVLLAQWAASRPDLRFIWIDVEAVDDDPIRFARKFLGRLRPLDPDVAGLAPLLRLGGDGLGEPLRDSLSALLADHLDLVLVFDDLHAITNRAIIDDLWWLADHLPPTAHVVFSSRGDLRLALSRHRLQYSLLELRQAELAFDDDVAAEVLERITGAPVSRATVASVLETTEGWAAGVQLSAISLRHQQDPEMFARRLAGTDRLISEYLSEQVLAAQSDERRDLLLRLSVLDRMSPALVESVLDVADAEALFDELERDSMFLVTVDEHHEWFRFHHLFRDLLRYRLRARHPDDEVEILSRAAEWFLTHGDVNSAIECLLHARSWDRAVELILARGREVFERGQAATVAQWLAAMPETERTARPNADALYGMVLGLSGRAALSEDVLRALVARPGVPVEVALIAHAYIAGRAQFRPQSSVTIAAAHESVRLLRAHPDAVPPDLIGLTDRTFLETLTLGSLARGHFLAGELVEARRWLLRAAQSPGAQYSVYRVHLLGSQALLEAWSGRLQVAQKLADEALQLAADVGLLLHPAPADAYLALSLIAIHRGRPQEAAFARHEGAVRAASNYRTQLMWIAYLHRVLAGDAPARSDEPVKSAPPLVREALDAAAGRTRRLSGGQASMVRAARAWSPTLVETIAEALTAKQLSEAKALLDAAQFAPREDTPLSTVEHSVLRAWLAHAEGRAAESRRLLGEALELAGEHGIVSVFAWAGPEVIRLVETHPARPTAFRSELLACAREQLRGVPDAALSEPLTDRERELLAYLPTRLTNAELADRFFVSVNTIKTHMAHIYRKLDAPNRSAAVARATDLGLL